MVTLETAVIDGIAGQDGSYLVELLLHRGYEVHGLIRRASTFDICHIEYVYQDPHDPNAQRFLHYGDIGNLEEGWGEWRRANRGSDGRGSAGDGAADRGAKNGGG